MRRRCRKYRQDRAKTGIDVIDSFIGGAIIDSGAIAATSRAILIDGASEVLSNETAIVVAGKTFTGGISNFGLISGASIGIDIVSAHPVSIFDAGTIIGSGGTAIEFSGSGNTLTLGAGYSIGGAVDPSGNNTLQLGGTGSATFDLSSIGSAAQYRGFTTFDVVGGTWTVTGAGGATSGWHIDGGTLEFAGGATLTSTTVCAAAGWSPKPAASPTSPWSRPAAPRSSTRGVRRHCYGFEGRRDGAHRQRSSAVGPTLRRRHLEVGSGEVFRYFPSHGPIVEFLSAGVFSVGNLLIGRPRDQPRRRAAEQFDWSPAGGTAIVAFGGTGGLATILKGGASMSCPAAPRSAQGSVAAASRRLRPAASTSARRSRRAAPNWCPPAAPGAARRSRAARTSLVASGGVAVSATIFSGGTEAVSAGGTDFGAQISGGTQLVFGLASFATVFSGEQLVQAGGKRLTAISGGSEVVAAGGHCRATVSTAATKSSAPTAPTSAGKSSAVRWSIRPGQRGGIHTGGLEVVGAGGTSSHTSTSAAPKSSAPAAKISAP